MLLDEPTTFLDLSHQIEVLDLLYELNQTQNRTIVMVLHNLNQACRYADYLVAMRQGYIYAQGVPTEVMTKAVVREVFGLESRIVTDPVAETPMCVTLILDKVIALIETSDHTSKASHSREKNENIFFVNILWFKLFKINRSCD